MVKVAGVDEAGRGPAIGPLVVAGILFDEETAEVLPSMGVRDSKKLSPRRRESLEAEIMDLADGWAFFDLQPRTIDKVVNRGVVYRKLNYLEAMAMATVIRDLAPHRAIVDPADTVIDRFLGDIKRVIPPGIEVHGESHADDIYPVAQVMFSHMKQVKQLIIIFLKNFSAENKVIVPKIQINGDIPPLSEFFYNGNHCFF